MSLEDKKVAIAHPVEYGADELQVILYLLSSNRTPEEISIILQYDSSFYTYFGDVIDYIKEYYGDYNTLPSYTTLRGRFFELLPPDPGVYNDDIHYLTYRLEQNKKLIVVNEMLDVIQNANNDNVDLVLDKIRNSCEDASNIGGGTGGTRYKADAVKREEEIQKMNASQKVSTGFAELDRCMYGGLSTFEEYFLVVARTNVGKSWVCSKIATAASKQGLNVLYFSPEMQGVVMSTRIDTWSGEGRFKNSDIMNAKFSDDYRNYLRSLATKDDRGEIYIVENKDFHDGYATVRGLDSFVMQNKVSLVIVDGLSYMRDQRHAMSTHEQFANISNDLFQLSKTRHCAVVVAVQANRETKKNLKDDETKGFPDLYNIQGSDAPGQIATGAIALRTEYNEDSGQKTLMMKIQKLRNAGFNDNILSYSWDPNVGEASLKDDESVGSAAAPVVTSTTNIELDTSGMPTFSSFSSASVNDDDADDDATNIDF